MDKQKCMQKTCTQEESPKAEKAKTQAGKNDDDIIYTGTAIASVPPGIIFDTTLSMKSDSDKHAVIWAYNL